MGCAACDIIPSLSSPELLPYARPASRGAGFSFAAFVAERRGGLVPAIFGAVIVGDAWEEALPKVSWADLAHAPAKAHLLVAQLEPSFFGGTVANDPFDSQRLREGANLMARVCTRLKLGGAHSATTSRAQSGSLVLCLFENREDRDKVADLVDARDAAEEAEGWASRRIFSLCSATHERLVLVGGETDNRYAGRRRRERERDAAAQSLRWGDA